MSAISAPSVLARDRVRGVRIPAAVLVAGGVAALGGAHGGYFPPEWGWAGLALAWLAAMALLLRPTIELGRLERRALGAWTALAAWYALSALWSASPTQSVLEAERALVYPLGLLAALVVVRRAPVLQLVVGVWGGIWLVALYGLATRVFPDRLGSLDTVVGRRLSAPIGYWNGLGLFCAMGALLALGLVAREGSLLLRAAAAASLVTLVPALYFTFSRGAWLAFALGLAAALAVDPRRLRVATATAAALLLPGLGVLLAARSPALVRYDALAGAAAREGHRLAVALAVLTPLAALAALAFARLERRIAIPERVRSAYGTALLLAALVGVSVCIVEAPRAYHSFGTAPVASSTLNGRLFSLSSSGRNEQFRVALHEFRAHPLLGSGAGTYEQWWLRERPLGMWKIRDAHNGYLETLGELGIVGLALLSAALLVPFAAVTRARRNPLVPAALGAYVAYLAHASVDWDWELSAVTLAAVLCAATVLRADDTPRSDVRPWARRTLLAVVAAAALAAGGGLLGNEAVARARSAVQASDWTRAEREARNAIRWAPWSAEGWTWLGEAEVGQGRAAAARVDLARAIARDRTNWELYFDLALVEPRGSSAQLAALRAALRLDPLSPEVAEFARGVGVAP